MYTPKTQKQTISRALLCLLLLAAGIYTFTKIPKLNPAKLIDARKDKAKNQYAIMIIQREAGFYGHTFVSASDYSRTDTVPKTLGFGFYADADDFESILHGKAKGKISNDFELQMYAGREIQLNLIIWVDRNLYEKCVNAVEAMGKRTIAYSLFNNDCVTLVQEIGSILRLKLPSRFLNPTPHQFVEALFKLN